MNYLVKNLTRRPVSILCNSGKTYHLPPKYEHELAGIEIENNAFIKKLQSRQIVELKPAGASKTVRDASLTAKSDIPAKVEVSSKDKASKKNA